MRKWLFWAILLIATGSAALSIGRKAARWIDKENTLLISAGGQAVNALRSAGEAGQTFLSRAGEKEMTILVTGVDDDRGNADVIMLVAMNLDEGYIRVLRIDSGIYARREGKSADEIGAVYTAAHAQALRQSDSQTEACRKGNIALKGFLKENMGIAIDHYISLNAQGLRSIVDSVGGLRINIPHDIDYDNGSESLHLLAGEQVLNGQQAADFIRLGSNSETEGLDSMKLFLSAFFRKIKQEFSLSTVIGLLQASLGNTISDLSLPDLIPLARGLLGVSSSEVKMTTLTGEHTKDEAGAEREVLCRKRTIKLLNEYLPYQIGIDEDHFDRHRVFTAAGVIDRLYYSDN